MEAGYEADDLIGCLAKNAEQAGFDVYMMTPDKDFGQLVSDRVRMYRPGGVKIQLRYGDLRRFAKSLDYKKQSR